MRWILLINLIKLINLQKFIKGMYFAVIYKIYCRENFQCKLHQMWAIPIIICAHDCPIVFTVTTKIRDESGEREISEYNQYVRQADSNRRNCDTFANY